MSASVEFAPPVNAWYTEMPVRDPMSVMKRTIGADGRVFKAITHQADVDYIWYFPDRHTIGFWSLQPDSEVASALIHDAQQRVSDRIALVYRTYGDQVYEEDFPKAHPLQV